MDWVATLPWNGWPLCVEYAKGGNRTSDCYDAPELQLTGLILSADAVSAGMPATVLKTHAKCFDVTARHAWRVKTLSLLRNTDVGPGNRRLSNRCCGALGAIERLAGLCRASYCDDVLTLGRPRLPVNTGSTKNAISKLTCGGNRGCVRINAVISRPPSRAQYPQIRFQSSVHSS